jgi:hypothetical protein
MFVPEDFQRSLKIIDPTYRVEDTEDKNGYYIIKDVDLSLRADGGKTLSVPDPKILRARGPLVILWTPHLNDECLERLRKMKLDALEMGIYDNPLKELAFWQRKRREAKEKNLELAVDMITEGVIERHRMETRKSWSYGGNKKKQEA